MEFTPELFGLLGALVIVSAIGAFGLYGANKYSKHTPAQ